MRHRDARLAASCVRLTETALDRHVHFANGAERGSLLRAQTDALAFSPRVKKGASQKQDLMFVTAELYYGMTILNF